MANDFLDIMRQKTLQRLNAATESIDSMLERVQHMRIPHRFLDIFKSNSSLPANIIAEVKFSSPSLGKIASSSDPVDVARQYLDNGASAISVLTEPTYFKGSLAYLEQIRNAFPNAKLLMKDFILDEYQLLQARMYGADAVLLIAAFLTYSQLELLHATAIDLGLTPLVEVHTLNELKNVEMIGAKFVGINNRNLESLKVDLDVSHRLSEYVIPNAIRISESGINDGNDIKNLQRLGYDGFLIGSQLMKDKSPGNALKKILNEVSDAS